MSGTTPPRTRAPRNSNSPTDDTEPLNANGGGRFFTSEHNAWLDRRNHWPAGTALALYQADEGLNAEARRVIRAQPSGAPPDFDAVAPGPPGYTRYSPRARPSPSGGANAERPRSEGLRLTFGGGHPNLAGNDPAQPDDEEAARVNAWASRSGVRRNLGGRTAGVVEPTGLFGIPSNTAPRSSGRGSRPGSSGNASTRPPRRTSPWRGFNLPPVNDGDENVDIERERERIRLSEELTALRRAQERRLAHERLRRRWREQSTSPSRR